VRGQQLPKGNSVLIALFLMLVVVPEIAAADGAAVAPGFRRVAYVGGYGYARFYGHPFDDGYDYPFGYGEYAEYGPWTYRSALARCYLTARKVWTGKSWLIRRARFCD
jgi:hypothetical protein